MRDRSKFSHQEVSQAIKDLAINKAVDDTRIESEMMKYGGEELHNIILDLCNNFLDIGEISTE